MALLGLTWVSAQLSHVVDPTARLRWINLMDSSVSIIVPAYNEAQNLEDTIAVIFSAAKALPDRYEIIVINDCSTDNTLEIAQRIARQYSAMRVINNAVNLGFGGAFMAGVEAASMKYSIMVCGDNVIEPEQLAKVFARVGSADLITTFYKNIHATNRVRRAVSRMYVMILNTLCGLSLHYYNGNNVYPTRELAAMRVSEGFGYASQIVVELINRGYSFLQVELVASFRKSGTTQAFRLKNIFNVVKTVVRLGVHQNRFVAAKRGIEIREGRYVQG